MHSPVPGGGGLGTVGASPALAFPSGKSLLSRGSVRAAAPRALQHILASAEGRGVWVRSEGRCPSVLPFSRGFPGWKQGKAGKGPSLEAPGFPAFSLGRPCLWNCLSHLSSGFAEEELWAIFFFNDALISFRSCWMQGRQAQAEIKPSQELCSL